MAKLQAKERFSPHSVESEEAVLGSILINPDALLEIAPGLDTADFFLVKHAWIFAAIKAIRERGDDIDTLTVSHELGLRGQLDQVGGSAYLLLLTNNTPTHIHVATYAAVVSRAAYRRRILATCSDMADSALQEDVEIDEVLAYCKTQFSRLLSVGSKHYGLTSKQLASANLAEWEQRQSQGGGILGLPSGSDALDVLIGGFEPDRVTFFGGRPKMGKTAAQLSVILRVARHLRQMGKRGWVYLYSLEMGASDITLRFLSAMTHIPLNRLALGRLSDAENSCYMAAIQEFADLKIFIDDSSWLSTKDIQDRSEIYSLRYGPPALIAVDYVQRIRGSRSKSYNGDNRATEVEDVAYGLAELAKDNHCHVIAGAQIKLDVDKRTDHRPTANDLAESDGILRAASHVVLLYRPGVYRHDDKSPEIEWILGANRHGETGSAQDMRWHSACACMDSKVAPTNF